MVERLAPQVGPALRILVVDDHPEMVGLIGEILGRPGHRIVAAYSGTEALRRLDAEDPDVVLLDLTLPDIDGATVCRLIRVSKDCPIIIVTGDRDPSVAVKLLEAGADDFLTKPFRGDELVARIGAVVRRGRRRPSGRPWSVDRPRHEIRWLGRQLPLTFTEFRLLAHLIDRVDEVVDSRELLSVAWTAAEEPKPAWLKRHMTRLRSKLSLVGAPQLVAVRGIGYCVGATVPDRATKAPPSAPKM